MQLTNLGVRWVDDESWYLMPIDSIQQEGKFRIPTVPGNDVFWAQPPILTYLEAVTDWIRPLSVRSARAIPIAFGLSLIAGTFLLGRRLFSPLTGLIAAAFVASDNLVFLASRIIRPEILVTSLLVFALYLAARGHDDQKRKWRWMLASASMCGLATACHPNGLILAPSVVLLTLFLGGLNKETFKTIFLFGILVLVFVAPFVIWMVAFDWANEMANFKGTWLARYGRTGGQPAGQSLSVLSLIRGEVFGRYKDFVQFPFRVHIAFFDMLSLILLLINPSRKVKALGVITLFSMAFFIFVNNSNPSVRYLAIPMPILLLGCAALVANWVVAARSSNIAMKLLVACLVVSLGFSSLVGNAFYLWKFRDADYDKVMAQVRTMLPKDSRVYGGMFLWFGLRDRTFIPYIRMPWAKALSNWKPTAVVMDDWVMAGGGPDGSWTTLTKELDEYLATNGTLVGTIDAGFYGKLRVFTLNQNNR